MKPRCWSSFEGRRHFDAIDVKLARAQDTGRKHHPAHNHCMAIRKDQYTIASAVGPKYAAVVCTDDKAKVKLGVAAAKCERKILMRASREVRLPDHSYSVGPKHNLIPSVSVVCNVKDDVEFGETQNTVETANSEVYVAVRSHYHSTTSINTHRNDLDYMINSKKFEGLLTEDGKVKPVFLHSNDGGTDLNVRNCATIDMWLDFFKKNDIDYLMVSQSAPNRSYVNKAEDFMSHLSFKLSGLVFDHTTFGEHLKNRKVVNEELCKENLYAAGTVLANDVWDRSILFGSKVYSRFIKAEDDAKIAEEKGVFGNLNDADWDFIKRHVRLTRHSIQIAKCVQSDCAHCSTHPVRCPIIFNILKSRFIPIPFAIKRQSGTVKPVNPTDVDDDCQWPHLWIRLALPLVDESLTMDTYNGELTEEMLKKLRCPNCGKQWPNQKLMKLHKKHAHHRQHGQGADDVSFADIDYEQWSKDYEFDDDCILRVVDKRRENEYLVVTNDESIEIMQLHPKVQEFEEYLDAVAETDDRQDISAVMDMVEWIQSDWKINAKM